MEKAENTFRQFGLSEEIIEALDVLGYQEPTEIQKQVIPLALSGKQVMAKSKTGSGKTAAFAIPLCEKIRWEENLPQALVLEPTRELTVQVKQEIFQIGRKKRLKVPDVFGGFPIDKQIQTLKQKSHIVVGTPGRVMDHVRRGSLRLEEVRYLVIDEADLMLDMGFAEEVTEIMESLVTHPAVMLFSATLEDRLKNLVSDYMETPIMVTLESDDTIGETIDQTRYETTQEEKYQALLSLLIQECPRNAMIFCGTREMVEVLGRRLKKEGIRCGLLHGEIDQRERLRTIDGFKEGRFRYLIATDVAARGVDVTSLSHVLNYDFPTGRDTYVHRIGRTGRNGERGKALSLYTDMDKKMVGIVEEHTGYQIPVRELPDRGKLKEDKREEQFWKLLNTRMELIEKKGAGFRATITRLSIGGGKKSKMRAGDIVGTICSIPGLTQEDIGIIDVRDSLTYVEILNGKGSAVLDALQEKTIKGKLRKVRITRGR